MNSFTLLIKKDADARARVELKFFALNLAALHAVSKCFPNKPQVNTSGVDKAVILRVVVWHYSFTLQGTTSVV